MGVVVHGGRNTQKERCKSARTSVRLGRHLVLHSAISEAAFAILKDSSVARSQAGVILFNISCYGATVFCTDFWIC